MGSGVAVSVVLLGVDALFQEGNQMEVDIFQRERRSRQSCCY
jgi:hypothetical protein